MGCQGSLMHITLGTNLVKLFVCECVYMSLFCYCEILLPASLEKNMLVCFV